MTKKEENEWEFSTGYFICIIVEFLLINGIVFYNELTNHSDYGFWNCIKLFALILVCFIIFFKGFFRLVCKSKIMSIGIIVLTILLGIVRPIILEYMDEKWQCYDRTTYDYDRNNDVKCINKYGEIKLMEYKDAKEMAPNAVSGWVKGDLSYEYTELLYRLVDEYMYDKNGNCREPSNIFDKESDAYYGYELSKRIEELEEKGKHFDTEIENRPHSPDFILGDMYNHNSMFGYYFCLGGCGLKGNGKKYVECFD